MRVFKFISILLLIFVSSANLLAYTNASQNTARHPSVEPLFTVEEELGYTPSEILTGDEVFTLSILFSECQLDTRASRSAMQKFQQIKNEVTSKEYKDMPEEDRGRAVLKLLYRSVLKEYEANQTRMTTLCETGYYNCVSSAILYMAAAKAAGLEVRGQKTPDHAFCTIYVKDSVTGKKRPIDVETTNPYGFNPGGKETIENEDNIKMYYVVPDTNYTNRQEVSDKYFTGIIANNSCVDYLDANDYFSAIPLYGAMCNLIKDEKSAAHRQAREDFFVFPTNYISLKTAGATTFPAEEYASLVRWYASFIARWGKNDTLQKNMDSAFNNLITFCYQQKNYDLADSSYKELKPYVTKKQLAQSEEIITELFINVKLGDAEPFEKIEMITSLLNSLNPTASQKKRFSIELENAWIIILTNCMNNYDFRGGYEYAQKAEDQIPTSATLRQITQVFYQNCIIEIHNNFVIQVNKGNYREAKKILEKGIADFPGDKTLSDDLALIKTVLP